MSVSAPSPLPGRYCDSTLNCVTYLSFISDVSHHKVQLNVDVVTDIIERRQLVNTHIHICDINTVDPHTFVILDLEETREFPVPAYMIIVICV